MARICILTPGPLGSTPRVVKEADALAAAGHQVEVIATRILDSVDIRDQAILRDARWTAERIDLRAALPRKAYRLVQAGAAAVFARTGVLAERAHSLFVPVLEKAALRRSADLFIAHYVAALPAAAKAARGCGALYAFDAEDFHPGDLKAIPQNAAAIGAIRAIESAWLPGCAYRTAASPGIARAYARTYGLPSTVILNTFPWERAPPRATARGRAEPAPSVYWFSQTIGPDRGLECAVRAIGKAQARPHLHLRGTVSSEYEADLRRQAAKAGAGDRLHFLPPAEPQEMERLAADFDLGLAAETGYTEARQVALTNKLFTYMLAGLPVVMSDTEGQRAIATELAGAALLYPVDNADELAARLDQLLLDSSALAAARCAAFELARNRFNWDIEQKALVAVVEAALAGRRP